MSKELIEQILNGDTERVIELIEKKGADVNYIAPGPNANAFEATPLHAAVVMKNALLVRILLEKGADPNLINISEQDKKYRFSISWEVTPLALFVAPWKVSPVNQEDFQIVALLLGSGANMFTPSCLPRDVDSNSRNYPLLAPVFMRFSNVKNRDYTPFSIALENNNYKLLSLYHCELFLRANYEKLTADHGELDISLEKLQAYFKLSRKRISHTQYELVGEVIDKLVTKTGLSNEKAISIKKLVAENRIKNTPNDSSAEPIDEADILCLKKYLAHKQSSDKEPIHPMLAVPLSSLTAELQYHLGNLDSPATNEQLSLFSNDSVDVKNYAHRAMLYDVSHLLAFINPEQRLNSVMAMSLTEAIIEIICQAAVHKDLPEAHQEQCKRLLHYYENLPVDVKLIVHTNKAIVKKIETTAAQVSTESALCVIKTIEAKGKKENAALHEKIDQLTALVLDLKAQTQVQTQTQNKETQTRTEGQQTNYSPMLF